MKSQRILWIVAGITTVVTISVVIFVRFLPPSPPSILHTTPSPISTPIPSPTASNIICCVQPTTTLTPTPFPTGTHQLPPPLDAHSGTIILDHALTKDAHKWDTSDDCAWETSLNAYHVKMQADNRVQCTARIDPIASLVFQVHLVFLTDQSCGGIFVRQVTSLLFSYQDFYICASGTFVVGSLDVLYNSLRNGSDQVIKRGAGQQNTIAIVAKDDTFILFVNGTQIDTVKTTDARSGAVGVEAVSSEVAFYDAQIWQI